MIFMGNGDDSRVQCTNMHRKLKRAFSNLSRVQVPPGIHRRVTDEELKREREPLIDEIEYIIKEISNSVGCKIEIVENDLRRKPC